MDTMLHRWSKSTVVQVKKSLIRTFVPIRDYSTNTRRQWAAYRYSPLDVSSSDFN